MTNTFKKLPVQSLARLSALALFAAALAAGCGSSDDSSSGTGGTGASAGKAGGTSKAGSAGTTSSGDAGESAGGSATTGGSSNHGGTSSVGAAGAEEGGEAGASSAALCGNGKLDPGEECDDGNTKSGDGCSSTCKKLCEQCETALCDTNPIVGSAASDLCYGTLGDAPASGGPAAGIAKSQLCQAVVDCVRKSQCAQGNWGLPFNGCYCGSEAFADCKTTPMGPCVEEIAEASESRDFNDIARVWGNGITNIAAGAAAAIITQCDQVACTSECFQDTTPTKCQKCTAAWDVQANNIPCAARYGDCYVAGPTATTDPSDNKQLSMSQLCAPANDCAQRTGCALNGVDSCYGNGSGPCAAEFAAAADSTDPATVLNRMHNFYYPATVAAQLLTCEATECESDCFPTASTGGSGGSGGSSAGTGGASTGGVGSGGSGG